MKQKPHIIIAEDDAFIRRAYTDGLERAGFTVTPVSDGVEALEAISSSQPDLMLLDIMMPQKDGFEVLQDLQKNSRIKPFPVIVLTNLSQEVDVMKVQELGAKDHLVKSNVSLKEVVAAVKKYLGM